jgi:hypothetical protein
MAEAKQMTQGTNLVIVNGLLDTIAGSSRKTAASGF